MRSSRVAGCLSIVLLLVVVIGAAAWFLRDDLARRLGWGGGDAVATEVSPEAAASAEAKLTRLREHGDTVRLSDIEFSSLLRYRLEDRIPDALQDPTVAFRGDTLRVGARFPTDLLPSHPDLDRIRFFLPDTARVDISGHLRPHDRERAAMEVTDVSLAGLPIPSRYYSDVLDRVGRRNDPGMPPNSVGFPLPEGVGAAWVENGFLVLTP